LGWIARWKCEGCWIYSSFLMCMRTCHLRLLLVKGPGRGEDAKPSLWCLESSCSLLSHSRFHRHCTFRTLLDPSPGIHSSEERFRRALSWVAVPAFPSSFALDFCYEVTFGVAVTVALDWMCMYEVSVCLRCGLYVNVTYPRSRVGR